MTQQAQENKFVESGLKNWALINWTTASEDLKDDWNKIANANMNKFTVRGDYSSYKSVETEYNYNLDCYNILFFLFLLLFLREGPSPYIVPLELFLPYTC